MSSHHAGPKGDIARVGSIQDEGHTLDLENRNGQIATV